MGTAGLSVFETRTQRDNRLVVCRGVVVADSKCPATATATATVGLSPRHIFPEHSPDDSATITFGYDDRGGNCAAAFTPRAAP